jgi:hypothetical protein
MVASAARAERRALPFVPGSAKSNRVKVSQIRLRCASAIVKAMADKSARQGGSNQFQGEIMAKIRAIKVNQGKSRLMNGIKIRSLTDGGGRGGHARYLAIARLRDSALSFAFRAERLSSRPPRSAMSLPRYHVRPGFVSTSGGMWGRFFGSGPMECGLTNPARAGRQQRQFALRLPWSP